MSAADKYPSCPLVRGEKNDLIRHCPPSQAVAHCFQLHDQLLVMLACANISGLEGKMQFQGACANMQIMLDSARRSVFLT